MDVDTLIKDAQIEHLENGNSLKAEELLTKAAEAGSGHAAHELGVLYTTGGKGLNPDHEKSQYWFEKSLESGFEKTIATDPEWFRKKSND